VKTGWLSIGDVGEIEAGGYMTFVGRMKALIIDAVGIRLAAAAIVPSP
jgi:long-subunit acyl-CoA synthetase (AMP-forming)